MRKSVFVIACVAAASLISCNKSTGNTIKVGGIAPLSGEVAVYGVECKNGIDLAVEEINAAGGVLGQQFEFIFEDDQGKSDQSVNVYKKLVAKDGVGLIVGSVKIDPIITRDMVKVNAVHNRCPLEQIKNFGDSSSG